MNETSFELISLQLHREAECPQSWNRKFNFPSNYFRIPLWDANTFVENLNIIVLINGYTSTDITE
jgi:hypothetical protein